jgi:hypothetical protein
MYSLAESSKALANNRLFSLPVIGFTKPILANLKAKLSTVVPFLPIYFNYRRRELQTLSSGYPAPTLSLREGPATSIPNTS